MNIIFHFWHVCFTRSHSILHIASLNHFIRFEILWIKAYPFDGYVFYFISFRVLVETWDFQASSEELDQR